MLKVLELRIEPTAVCPLNAPLSIALVYQLMEPVPAAVWEIVYEADFTNKRQAIHIHSAAPVDLPVGTFSFAHSVDTVKTDGIKEKYLLQVGVLKLTLKGNHGAENVASVNMVTQVSKDPATGVLLRNIMNPLE